jgi:hypothetical protein
MIAMGMSVTCCACSETLPGPGAYTASPTAAVPIQARVCEDGRAWQAALDALPAAALAQVEPTYVRDTCAGTGQVTGVTIALPRAAVESAPWGWLLGCAAVRVPFAEGDRPAQGASPAWTPDGWVDIAVERERDAVLLRVSADSVPKNIRLFRSVIAFAHATRE